MVDAMIVAFAVRRVPHDPRGEWASGIEDGGRFYPSIHFPSRSGAQGDAAAAVKASPQLADELHKLIRRR